MHKIGLSYSKCILDIIEKRVDSRDVLVIVCGTNFDPYNDQDWKNIWLNYCQDLFNNAPWQNFDYENPQHEKLFRSTTIDLYQSGKLHQPRRFGKRVPERFSYHWLDTIFTQKDLENNPAAKKAWENYKIIMNLSKTHDYE